MSDPFKDDFEEELADEQECDDRGDAEANQDWKRYGW